MFGLGGLGYSFSWLYVAFMASSVGSIPQTKDAIHIVAALSIAMLLFWYSVSFGTQYESFIYCSKRGLFVINVMGRLKSNKEFLAKTVIHALRAEG
ncbi:MULTISPECIES: hypothetical protein [Propionispira]|uniref:hypothetical protein n=1 Tax=Propionispira TaxID=84034 RepID=UPI00038161B9|nr:MULTISPECIES: hypothetical protein [Propionispira]